MTDAAPDLHAYRHDAWIDRSPGSIAKLGGVRFPVTGPVRYTMTARDAVECHQLHPRTAIPIHYEGWTHFRHGRDVIEREFAKAPDDGRTDGGPVSSGRS